MWAEFVTVVDTTQFNVNHHSPTLSNYHADTAKKREIISKSHTELIYYTVSDNYWGPEFWKYRIGIRTTIHFLKFGIMNSGKLNPRNWDLFCSGLWMQSYLSWYVSWYKMLIIVPCIYRISGYDFLWKGI